MDYMSGKRKEQPSNLGKLRYCVAAVGEGDNCAQNEINLLNDVTARKNTGARASRLGQYQTYS